MSRTIYALLVGIDAYPPPVRPLNGCVNDIQRMHDLLQERVGYGSDRFEPLVLTNAQATRQGIIDAFRSHLGQAGAGDVTLFYYSGHGSQAPSPPEFWPLEPDRLDETLVCVDSRSPNGWDLADKELARLLAEVAESDAHVLVILDCCHAGSGTRAPEIEVRVRRAPRDDRQRPLDTFIVSAEAAAELGNSTRSLETGSGWTLQPRGRHVVFSACRAEEEAKELSIGGESRGVFSYYLLDTLQRAGRHLTYRDLCKRVNALVRSKVAGQTPLLEASETADLDRSFLSGAVSPRPAYFTLSHDAKLGWIIDGGAVHGIAPVQGEETTDLALFPFDAQLDERNALAGAIGAARVTSTLAHASRVAVSFFDGKPSIDQTYKAVVTALPLPPLRITIEGEGAATERVRAALAATGPEQPGSLLVAEAEGVDTAELRLLGRDAGYRIVRVGDSFPLAVDVPGTDEAAAALAVARLEHIARWMRLVDLANPASHIDTDAVEVHFYRVAPDGELAELTPDDGGIRLAYTYGDGQWHAPRFKIRLTNAGNRRLYCALLDLTQEYEIISEILLGSGAWLDPGQNVWALGGAPLYGEVPRRLWEEGMVETHDLAKLIVSSAEFDATLLAQDALPVTLDQARSLFPTEPRGQMNTLNRLMNRVRTRRVRRQPEPAEEYVDWTASEISVTFVRPQAAVDVAGQGRHPSLGSGVTLQGHPRLKAKARLTSLVEAGRSLGTLALPSLLREDPTVSQPFQFSISRSGEPGLSVLELFDVENRQAVTSTQPLVLQASVPLAPSEHVLPVAYDGEFFLPLGTVQPSQAGVTIRLDHLPAPTAAGGHQDLNGSIRILFQKFVGDPWRWEAAYPVLAATSLGKDGLLSAAVDVDAVRARVAQAGRIVLVIHGITGDTRGMALTALRHLTAADDAGALVLAFDYENIDTPIEETARALKERLAAVGLGPNHGKDLTVIAHSVGGLVSRWFIEQEEGEAVVQHLVMCGTPNEGFPWPTIQTWATMVLGIGLNNFSTMTWPAQVLASLQGAIEAAGVTLDQMLPDSDILEILAHSPDPGVRYTVLAGNASLVPAALQPSDGGAGSPIERLLDRLSPQTLLHGTTALAFFGRPNDMAVSVESMGQISPARSPQPTVVTVACDHLTYFSAQGEVGPSATARFLGQGPCTAEV